MNDSSNPPGLILAQKPVVKKNLKKPQSIRMSIDMHFERETAEQLFPVLKFEPEDTHVTITEVLRPAKTGEKALIQHLGSHVGYVIDHYEFEGHTL